MDEREMVFSAHGLWVVAVTVGAVIACILLHYEAFAVLQKVLGSLHPHVRRRRILVLMFGLLALHVADVWLFGLGYYVLIDGQSVSGLLGSQGGGLLDFVYFSAVVYTTLGFGDLVPTGAIRFMTGTEALTGFLLITWSASFTFLEMQRFWRN
jgi:Ion channel